MNTKVDGVDAFATSDLLVPHPTKPEYYRIFGRSDDQIIHSTGEKVCACVPCHVLLPDYVEDQP